jgi:nitrite reductase (NADH) large subunit
MYVIIGQGVAGTTAANTLRRLDPGAPITVVTAEADSFYNRIDLPDIIEGKIASAELQAAAQFAARDITCLMANSVDAIRPDTKRVTLASGEDLAYDKLLLATGSVPVLPPLEGIDAVGVASLWTMADARRIVARAGLARRTVVVGAGLIGLKTALALAGRGVAVTVVEKLPRVMPRQLDDTASAIVAGRLAAKGIDLRLGDEVSGILTGQGAVKGVAVAGRTIACEALVMAIGVKPNSGLAAAAGLTVRRGIVVDALQRTSVKDIYAAGDVAESLDRLTGTAVVPATWPVAAAQGRVAAANMAGQPADFDGSVAMNSVDIAGLALVSVGDIEGQDGDEVLVSRRDGSYRKVVLRDHRLRGVLCLGDIRQAGVLAGMVWRQVAVPAPARLLSPAFSFRDFMPALRPRGSVTPDNKEVQRAYR